MAHVGLDIGTSNCCCFAATDADAAPQIVPSAVGGRLTPAAVAYTHKAVMVGEPALQQVRSNATSTFIEFKRVIGRTYEQKRFWKDAKHWPFTLMSAGDDRPPIYTAMHCGEVLELTALDLTSTLVTTMAEAVRAHLGPGRPVAHVTVTVPAHFGPGQRDETVRAVTRAGLGSGPGTISVLNEPSAAALAYGDKIPVGKTVVVVDLGAGTLDVTCVRSAGGGRYEVLPEPKFCDDLGGANFDQRLLALASAHHKKHTRSTLRNEPERLATARLACEQAKRTLTVHDDATIFISEAIPPLEVTRAEFEAAIAPDVRRIAETVHRAIAENPPDLAILCGGATRVPAVRAAVEKALEGVPVHTDLNADECVAYGACLHARGAVTIRDVASGTVGVCTGVNVMHPLVPRGAPLPATAECRLVATGAHADIAVFVGEAGCTDANERIGVARLDGLREGHPKVALAVTVSADGLIELSARDDEGHSVDATMKLKGTI